MGLCIHVGVCKAGTKALSKAPDKVLGLKVMLVLQRLLKTTNK